MRKIMVLMLVLTMMVSCLVGCNTQTDSPSIESEPSATQDTAADTDAPAVADAPADTDAPALADTSKISGESGATEFAYADVENGKLMGYKVSDVYSFKGIPYATAERFMAPKAVEPWEDTLTALKYREICPQNITRVRPWEFNTPSGVELAENEDCQFLNVWTKALDASAKKPVIFWLHGGGYSSGSSNELAFYDGNNIVDRGDVVFVSVNHRLNLLGYLDLSAYGDEYKDSGNVGMLDIVFALQWVKDNIDQFGGDPDNVTIVGQSGGACKVYTLMAMPSAKGLFHKAVGLSGGPSSLTHEQAKEQVANFIGALGLSESEVNKLKTMDLDELYAAAGEVGLRYGPVVDGEVLPEKTINENGEFTSISKDIPLITSSVFSEYYDNLGPMILGRIEGNYLPDLTDDVVMQRLEEEFGDDAQAIADEFRKAYPEHDLCDVLFINKGRTNNTALSKASLGGAPVYQCVWAYNLPVCGGTTSYHTGGDLPFLFDNIDTIGYLVAGDEVNAQAFAEETSMALISFAYNGDPNYDGMAPWTPFTVEEGATMIFDNISETRNYHDAALLELINGTE